MTTLIQDLKYGLRMLARNPGFTAVAVLTLALGIGANTAIFSVVNAVLLRPLPYRDANRLVIVWEQNLPRGWTTNIVSTANFGDWRRQNTVFSDMAAVDPTSFNLTGVGEPMEIEGEHVTANLFTLLGVSPMRGRGFVAADDEASSPPVAIVSYGLWQRYYGGDTQVHGHQISLDGHSYTVVGIMPPDFTDAYTSFFNIHAQVWVPGLDMRPRWRAEHAYLALARLKPGVALKQAQAEMDTIARRIENQYPENKGWSVAVVGMHDQIVGAARPVLLVLVAAVAFVLLIACANLANLLLARAASREKEIAVRSALGASSSRMLRQLLTESFLLALFGGGLGVLIAAGGTKVLVALSPSALFLVAPGLNAAALNGGVLSFVLLLTLATGFLFGLAPALGMSRPDLTESLKGSGRGASESGRGHRVRGFLVTAEFALAFVLVIGAGLMIGTLVRITHFNLGFNPHNVLTLRIPLRGPQYREQRTQARFFEQLLGRVDALPGVVGASVSRGLPIEGQNGMDFVIEENPTPRPEETPAANYQVVASDYFRTMGIPLRQGRVFSQADMQDSQRVVIVNEELVREYWPGQNPLGKRLKTGIDPKLPWLTVVGVAGNVRTEGPDVGFEPELYIPYTQYPWLLDPRHLVVRTAGDPLALAQAVRREVMALDTAVPIADVRPLDQIAGEPLAPRQFLMTLLAVFAALALVLAGVGIYGVMAYSVAQRTHEFGIRMALGAQTGDVLRSVVAQGLLRVGIGLAIGSVASLALADFMSSLLFQIQPTDPATFLAVALGLIGLALVACYIPARRAAKVDPIVALRYE
ncbi:MAG: ABC transporter permease [Terriglobia bacterium]|jgi:putative ABC transport system permease protein